MVLSINNSIKRHCFLLDSFRQLQWDGEVPTNSSQYSAASSRVRCLLTWVCPAPPSLPCGPETTPSCTVSPAAHTDTVGPLTTPSSFLSQPGAPGGTTVPQYYSTVLQYYSTTPSTISQISHLLQTSHLSQDPVHQLAIKQKKSSLSLSLSLTLLR